MRVDEERVGGCPCEQERTSPLNQERREGWAQGAGGAARELILSFTTESLLVIMSVSQGKMDFSNANLSHSPNWISATNIYCSSFFMCCSATQLCSTLCDPMGCSISGFPVLYYLLKFAQTRALSQWCHPTICPLLPPSPPSFNLSQCQGLFQWVSSLHQVAKLSFSFSMSPSNEHSGMIFFRIDWCDLLAVQGTLQSLLQHCSSKASVLWRSAFLMVQLSHPYMSTAKIIPLTIWTFVFIFWSFTNVYFISEQDC